MMIGKMTLATPNKTIPVLLTITKRKETREHWLQFTGIWKVSAVGSTTTTDMLAIRDPTPETAIRELKEKGGLSCESVDGREVKGRERSQKRANDSKNGNDENGYVSSYLEQPSQ